MCVCVGEGGRGRVNKVHYGLCEIGELACEPRSLIWAPAKRAARERASERGVSLAFLPRVHFLQESINLCPLLLFKISPKWRACSHAVGE